MTGRSSFLMKETMGTKEQWRTKGTKKTMEGSKGTKEQWEDQKNERNNGRIKRNERTIGGSEDQNERNNGNKEIMGMKRTVGGQKGH